jgi:putative phosphoribosyl transferase
VARGDESRRVSEPRYRDRRDGGKQLASRLQDYAGRPDVVVLALPRGGVPVGYEIARALSAPLDVFVVRKLGVPGHAELAMGAIATGGGRHLNHDVIDSLGIRDEVIEAAVEREQREVRRRERLYRGERPPLDVAGRSVILVDDGLATGASMQVAIEALRRQRTARIVVAVPVGAAETCTALRAYADEVVCGRTTLSLLRRWAVVRPLQPAHRRRRSRAANR